MSPSGCDIDQNLSMMVDGSWAAMKKLGLLKLILTRGKENVFDISQPSYSQVELLESRKRVMSDDSAVHENVNLLFVSQMLAWKLFRDNKKVYQSIDQHWFFCVSEDAPRGWSEAASGAELQSEH